jgi:hypothetical protein
MIDLKGYTYGELLAVAAAHVTDPTNDEILFQLKLDMNRNPHNEHNKPPRRGRVEVIADYKLEIAKAILAGAEKLSAEKETEARRWMGQ